MAAINLRDIIVRKLSKFSSPMDDTVPPLAHAAISESITEYMTTVVTVVGSYSGVTPAGTPEMAAGDVLNITGVMPPLGIPSSFDEWISNISNGIKSSFYMGMGVSHPLAPTLAFPMCNIIANQRELYDIHMNEYENPQGSVLLKVCEWITDSIELGVIPTVPAGIAGTGVYTVSKVNV